MVVSVVRFFRWCPVLLPLGYRLALVIAKYIFTNSLKICLPLPIGKPKQLFFKQTSYLIPLLAAISKLVLCHPIFQLDQFPTYIWVNATPPPSSGLVQSRFMYHPRLHLYYIFRGSAPPPPCPTRTRMARSYDININPNALFAMVQ